MASGDWNVVLGSALNFVCSLGSHCTYNRKHLCITEATVDGKSGCVLRALEADTRSALPAPPPTTQTPLGLKFSIPFFSLTVGVLDNIQQIFCAGLN